MNASESKARIFLIEDEPSLAEMLAVTLREQGFEVRWFAKGEGVVEAVREAKPDVVLLDVVLPKTPSWQADGFEICRAIRAFSSVPLIMITSRVDEIDRLMGLDLGADDYVCKPVVPREVVARVRALLRRTLLWSRPQNVNTGLMIDAQQFSAHWDGEVLDLTPVEFRLLQCLSKFPGRVYSRAQLLDAIYADHRAVADRTVDSHIKNLRKKLHGVKADCDWIEAVYGLGYKFVLP